MSRVPLLPAPDNATAPSLFVEGKLRRNSDAVRSPRRGSSVDLLCATIARRFSLFSSPTASDDIVARNFLDRMRRVIPPESEAAVPTDEEKSPDVSPSPSETKKLVPTLSDKSNQYRLANELRWAVRQSEKRAQHDRTLRRYRINPQIVSFYEARRLRRVEFQQRREAGVGFEKEAQRLNVPTTLEYEVTFKPYSKSLATSKLNLAKGRRLSNMFLSPNQANAATANQLRQSSDVTATDAPRRDLVVRVLTVKGVPLKTSTMRVYKETRLSCHLLPYNGLHSGGAGRDAKGLQTSYVPVKSSQCQFQHEFSFKGIPLRFCKEKHVTIELKGRAGNERVVIGTLIIAGPSALIKTSSGLNRSPNPQESDAWSRAFEKTGTPTNGTASFVSPSLGNEYSLKVCTNSFSSDKACGIDNSSDGLFQNHSNTLEGK